MMTVKELEELLMQVGEDGRSICFIEHRVTDLIDSTRIFNSDVKDSVEFDSLSEIVEGEYPNLDKLLLLENSWIDYSHKSKKFWATYFRNKANCYVIDADSILELEDKCASLEGSNIY